MREILFKNMTSVKNRRKAISVVERAEDKECKTHVRKSFVYVITPELRVEQEASQPEIKIRKCYNSKTREEKFTFRVKGYFFISKELSFVRVNFSHTLKINIHWKTKVFSPKSATLT